MLLLKLFSAGTSPVPGAPVTGTVSPNSPVQKPTTAAEKKQAYYIANEQGYCLEFRLSDESVNSYATYKNVRDMAKYKNNGWKPLKDWLLTNGFTCTWADNGWPAKDGVRFLPKGLAGVLDGIEIRACVIGSLAGAQGTTHVNDASNAVPGTVGDCCAVICTVHNASWGNYHYAEWAWKDRWTKAFKKGDIDQIPYLLFVRPL